jgi:hypothetical protein
MATATAPVETGRSIVHTSLSAHELFEQAPKTRFDFVLLPFGKMRIRSISDLDRIEYELAETNAETGDVDIQQLARRRARLVSLCAVSDTGTRLFSDADVERIAGWDAGLLKRLYVGCSRHCGINDAEVERFGKNLGRVLDSDSP